MTCGTSLGLAAFFLLLNVILVVQHRLDRVEHFGEEDLEEGWLLK